MVSPDTLTGALTRARGDTRELPHHHQTPHLPPGGWTYLGKSRAQRGVDINGLTMHKRTVTAKYGHASVKRLREMGIDAAPSALMWKHTYALGFDRQIRSRLRRMSRPYPRPEEAAQS